MVVAVYNGSTVTKDMLSLSTEIQGTVNDVESLIRSIMGMLALATQSRENSNKALMAFQEIRREFIDVRSAICYAYPSNILVQIQSGYLPRPENFDALQCESS